MGQFRAKFPASSPVSVHPGKAIKRAGKHITICKRMSAASNHPVKVGLGLLVLLALYAIAVTNLITNANLMAAYPIISQIPQDMVAGTGGQNKKGENPVKSQKSFTKENRTSDDVVSCKKKHVAATGGFCLDENSVFDGYNYVWDGMLCAGLEKLFGPNATVADIGAGLGSYGRCFLRIWKNVIHTKNNYEMINLLAMYETEMKKAKLLAQPQVIKSWKGYDGALNIETLSNGFIKYLDVSKKQDLGERFDWVMSVEVGEHIPHEYENIFLQNLVRHACK
ncbi:hypothetical protein SK128_012696, partial [Halocaridina rubra]